MSDYRPTENVVKTTISATLPSGNDAFGNALAGNCDVPTGGAPYVAYECTTATSTPVVKVYVKSDANGTWRKWRSFQRAVDTDTNTLRTPDTSITLVAGDQIIVPCAGFYAVRLDLQSGTSAALVGRTAESMADIVSGTSGGASKFLMTAEFTGFNVQVTPTVGTAAYVAGDVIGGILTFATANYESGRPIRLESVSMVDKSQQSIPCTFMWFSATPSGGTYTDGSALVFGSGDYAKFQAMTRVMETEWITYPATPTDDFMSKNDLGTHIALSGTSLFALLIADDAFSLTNGDLIINVAGKQI